MSSYSRNVMHHIVYHINIVSSFRSCYTNIASEYAEWQRILMKQTSCCNLLASSCCDLLSSCYSLLRSSNTISSPIHSTGSESFRHGRRNRRAKKYDNSNGSAY